MPRPKRHPLSFVQQMMRLKQCSLDCCPQIEINDVCELEPLNQRIIHILGISEKCRKQSGYMLFFVMYDIENDKVRRLVVRYLQREGCTRIQKSIFLADLPTEKYNQIRQDLTEVQAVYDNGDSIIVLPVSSDYLNMMRVIGKNIDIDIVTHNVNTLFF